MSRSPRTNGAEQREARWRKLIERQVASGRSIAAFCRDESIPTQTFYWWRKRLGEQEPRPRARGCRAKTPFIDLGALGAGLGGGLDIRLDLPGGITLAIARR